MSHICYERAWALAQNDKPSQRLVDPVHIKAGVTQTPKKRRRLWEREGAEAQAQCRG